MNKRSGPVTDHGKELMRRAQLLTAARWRVFPWGTPPGKEADQPLWRGYRGDVRHVEWRLVDAVWDRATGIGIACPWWMIGLDVDVKGDKDGDRHYIDLQGHWGALPEGPFTVTRSGGRHHLYRREHLGAQTRFRSHVALASGMDADIDVIHGGYRYFKCYDDAFWLRVIPQRIPELPASWDGAVTKDRGMVRVARVAATLTGRHSTHRPASLDALVERARQTTQGRNDRLHTTYFEAVRTGWGSDETRERFRDAGLLSGLPSDEVEKTLDSVERALREERFHPRAPSADVEAGIRAWLARTDDMTGSLRPGARRDLRLTAHVLAETARLAGRTDVIGMSCRQAAELLNVSWTTASRRLARLRQLGLISVVEESQATRAVRYRLEYAGRLHSDTVLHPAPPAPLSGFHEGSSPRQDAVSQVATVVSHDAFARMGRGPVLPRGAAEILVELRNGPRTRADLIEQLGIHRSTVSRALRVLESAGLVEVGGRGAAARLQDDDLGSALDSWAQAMGATGRTAARRDRHLDEREDRLAPPRRVDPAGGPLHAPNASLTFRHRIRPRKRK